jgi:hypothetical protein
MQEYIFGNKVHNSSSKAKILPPILVRLPGGSNRLVGRKGIKDALAQREKEFIEVSEETGGSVALPASAAELIDQASEIARRIDSQYVVSYKPTRPLNSATSNEYRKIDVIPRRVGLQVIVRRCYVARIPG